MKSGFEKIVSLTKAPLSAALVLLLLALQTLSVSADLHGDLHADAGAADHECAVTLLSNGQIDLSEPALDLPIAPILAKLSQTAKSPFVISPLLSFPSSRGPPVLA